MEITTIVGIVVAVIIILIGLRMVLRKSDDAAPSLESELHINSESNQPVIPRHVRDQLQADPPKEAARVEPDLNTLNATSVAEEAKSEKVAVPVETVSEKTTVTTEQVKAEVTEVKAAEPEQSSEVISTLKTDETQSTEVKTSTATEEFSLNPNIETAEIKEFDEESSILDVHLHEQQRFDDESTLANAESIIALNVYPNPRKALSGDKTLKVLLKYGLRFGELSCFHRYDNIDEPSPLMFSVLRITDEGPAGFDLETLSAEQVKGLAFFLALPHSNVQKGFDTMASIAGLIAREVDGTVYDENNLEFTPQLKEHWRHKAIDYRSEQEA
ncbi:cell division protein ZipA C-terminal FtsZ-binding domain-containing protein [Acinetobacter sichuanensis]|uniref:Cell division protein ZipA n=1 Tax=Acinetobacter sichuanensis TaxID=2136183 RepID=A0A371YQ13_9GAMM|nr:MULTISPECIES: cell division protein ZipA C-terminal FtsZ-binding domain-containing protein [Acinetobacter]MDM1762750.1 cell division protein ZipA [Acinetobacter sp. 226-1]MDM1766229.1 cell division protein ZipA [Acinetobacter sp. 226-4]RFC83543.1 cell division protein ZipA [Acinetobacter sichuanensis]